jgi:hypothetical protein
MEQSPYWEAWRSSASQKIPAFYGTRRFIAMFTSARHLALSWASSADNIGGNPVQITGTGGPGPDCLAYVFVFLRNIITCRLYKLTLSDQAQVTLQLRVCLSDLV